MTPSSPTPNGFFESCQVHHNKHQRDRSAQQTANALHHAFAKRHDQQPDETSESRKDAENSQNHSDELHEPPS